MSDFFQTGAVATIHRLGHTNLQRLESELCAFSQETPIALVLPCHVREIGTKALKLILRELERVTYLKQIVVGSTAPRAPTTGTACASSSDACPTRSRCCGTTVRGCAPCFRSWRSRS